MNKRVIGIVGTVLIHIIVPIYLLWPKAQVPPQPPPPPPTSKVVSVSLIPQSSSEDSRKGNDPGVDGAPDPKICADKDPSYEGIGITHSFGTELVLTAPATYPAYKAGIRIGDMVVELYRIPSTNMMFVHVNRHGKHLKFKVKREKICFREEDEPEPRN